MTCDAFDAALEELALGQVSEPDRSALLAHASTCTRCAAELADVVAVTDRLLELAPEVEPPLGFEQRVVATAGPAPRRWTRPLLVAGAGVAAAVVAVVLLVLPSDGDRSATVLTAAGEPAGSMSLDGDTLVLHLYGDDDWPGTWTCEVLTEDGWVEVGTWTSDDVVDDSWSVDVEDGVAADAAAMRVRSGRGDVLYTAALD